MHPKRILIVENQTLVAQGIANLLLAHTVTIATNRQEALQFLSVKQFDYAFVEIALGDDSGLALIQPLLMARVKPVMISGTASIGQLRACIRLGAYGFVNKCLDSQHFLEIFSQVEAGQQGFPAEIVDDLRQNPALVIPKLGRSEKRLLDYFVIHAEQTNLEIADGLAVSEGRIRNCLTVLMRKFDVKGRANLVKEAILRGYFPGIDRSMHFN